MAKEAAQEVAVITSAFANRHVQFASSLALGTFQPLRTTSGLQLAINLSIPYCLQSGKGNTKHFA